MGAPNSLWATVAAGLHRRTYRASSRTTRVSPDKKFAGNPRSSRCAGAAASRRRGHGLAGAHAKEDQGDDRRTRPLTRGAEPTIATFPVRPSSFVHARADELAREWASDPEYLGCMLLMLVEERPGGPLGDDIPLGGAAGTRTNEAPRPDRGPARLAGGRRLPLWSRHRRHRLARRLGGSSSCVTEMGLSSRQGRGSRSTQYSGYVAFRVDANRPGAVVAA